MSLYNSFQLIWTDSAGEHLFVSDRPDAFNAAMTLAIALNATNSATSIQIVECGTNNLPNGDAGIWYRERFSWNKGI